MNFYPFHIGDYASATAHLSTIEDCMYRRLLDCYYVHEKPIPLEERAAWRLVRATTDEERRAVSDVLVEFFQKAADGWRHGRCDIEIARAAEKRLKAQESAKASLRKRGLIPAESGERSLPNGEAIPPEKAYRNTLESERSPAGRTNAQESAAIANLNGSERSEILSERGATNPNPNPSKKKRSTSLADFSETGPEEAAQGEPDLTGEPPPARLPPCPMKQIVALYREILPELPAPLALSAQRASYVVARWREVVAEDKLDQAAGLEFIRGYFLKVRRSRWLMGQVPAQPGRRVFRADFVWLFKHENFLKVLEGRYTDDHQGRQVQAGGARGLERNPA